MTIWPSGPTSSRREISCFARMLSPLLMWWDAMWIPPRPLSRTGRVIQETESGPSFDPDSVSELSVGSHGLAHVHGPQSLHEPDVHGSRRVILRSREEVGRHDRDLQKEFGGFDGSSDSQAAALSTRSERPPPADPLPTPLSPILPKSLGTYLQKWRRPTVDAAHEVCQRPSPTDHAFRPSHFHDIFDSFCKFLRHGMSFSALRG